MGRLLGRIADFIRETDKLLLSLCLLASSYGIDAVRVDNLSDLEFLLEKDLSGPLVIEVVVENENIPLPK